MPGLGEMCRICKFFEHTQDDWGLCRRRAPAQTLPAFPEVDEKTWCGEYEPFARSKEDTTHGTTHREG